MNFAALQKEIFDNLNLLSSEDDTSIREGKVTLAGVKRNINNLIREVIFNRLSDKFPEDFERTTYPFSTYTATGTASTVGTTLTATTAIFDNSMEGFSIENATLGESAVIKTYTSPTVVVLKTAPTVDWTADTVYVLGNIYSFGSDTTDLKVIRRVGIQYASTDTYFNNAKLEIYENLVSRGNETFSKSAPYFYRTTTNEVDSNNVARPKAAIGILPFPDSYLGKIKVAYIEKPPELIVDTDVPVLDITGLGQCVIEGVTAWGFRKLEKFDVADRHEAKYQEILESIIRKYRPHKFKTSRIEESAYWSNLKSGII